MPIKVNSNNGNPIFTSSPLLTTSVPASGGGGGGGSSNDFLVDLNFYMTVCLVCMACGEYDIIFIS